MVLITAATTNNIGKTYGLRLEFNQASAGLVTIADDNGTKGVIAIGRTAAWVGYGFTGNVVITNASAENISVSLLNHQ